VSMNVATAIFDSGKLVCNQTYFYASGSGSCDVSGYNGTAVVTFVQDGGVVGRFFLSIWKERLGDVLGAGMSVFIFLLFYVPIVFGLGSIHPIAGIVGVLLAIIITGSVGLLTFVNLTVIIAVGVGAILTAWRIRYG